MKKHRKHADLKRRSLGNYGCFEISILGSKCSTIKKLVNDISIPVSEKFSIAYVDASHEDNLQPPLIDSYTFHNSGNLLKHANHPKNPYTDKLVFSEYDLVFINGNHYPGKKQIILLDPAKESSIEKRMDQINDISCFIIFEKDILIFDCLYDKFPNLDSIPKFVIEDLKGISDHILTDLESKIPEIRGLVLAGGQSLRMGKDKGLLDYFGKSQRSYTAELLQKLNLNTFLSVRKEQKVERDDLIEDVFLGLGPFGAICSAFQQNPNVAWLTLATDLPYIDERIILSLLENRDPSKLATAVKGKGKKFPEPLITIWEPKAYPVLLQYLSLGISCPRKVLINSDVKTIETDDDYLFNVNTPEEYDVVKKDLKGI